MGDSFVQFDANNALARAISDKDIPAAELAIAMGADVNGPNAKNQSKLEMMGINTYDKNEESLLLSTLKRPENLSIIRLLLANKATVKSQYLGVQAFGFSIYKLKYAKDAKECSSQLIAIVIELLQAETDVNVVYSRYEYRDNDRINAFAEWLVCFVKLHTQVNCQPEDLNFVQDAIAVTKQILELMVCFGANLEQAQSLVELDLARSNAINSYEDHYQQQQKLLPKIIRELREYRARLLEVFRITHTTICKQEPLPGIELAVLEYAGLHVPGQPSSLLTQYKSLCQQTTPAAVSAAAMPISDDPRPAAAAAYGSLKPGG